MLRPKSFPTHPPKSCPWIPMPVHQFQFEPHLFILKTSKLKTVSWRQLICHFILNRLKRSEPLMFLKPDVCGTRSKGPNCACINPRVLFLDWTNIRLCCDLQPSWRSWDWMKYKLKEKNPHPRVLTCTLVWPEEAHVNSTKDTEFNQRYWYDIVSPPQPLYFLIDVFIYMDMETWRSPLIEAFK